MKRVRVTPVVSQTSSKTGVILAVAGGVAVAERGEVVFLERKVLGTGARNP